MQHQVIIETHRKNEMYHIASVAEGPDFLRSLQATGRTGTDAYTTLRAEIRNAFSGVHTFTFIHAES